MSAGGVLSTRARIFLGCISLTLVTILVGFMSDRAQIQLSDTTRGIYDKAFIPMSYLRSAQSIVLSVSRDIADDESGNAAFVDQLQSALDALDVAHERAMSPRGELLTRQLEAEVSSLQAKLKDVGQPPDHLQFKAVEQTFDMAVNVYAGDGLHFRKSVEALVRRTQLETRLAVLGSVITAVAITLILGHAIVPSIRNAVKIATAIAAGKLDNRIERCGPRETVLLLDALATMQGSIAEKIACIESLMDRQASSHAAEIAVQHARFEAALDNMTMGLCMFDAGNQLLVHNKRFIEMFAPQGSQADIPHMLLQFRASEAEPLKENAAGSRSFSCLLGDGRTIAVSEEAMDGGGRVVTYEDISERQRTEERLSHMARHDALTGLPNRVLFRECLDQRLAQVAQGGALAVLCLDLDQFKFVNDTLGHPIGDALLRQVAARLLKTVAQGDMIVRLGGDEFAVIQYTNERGRTARTLAERIIGVMKMPFEVEGQTISIGTSIGIAVTYDGRETSDDLLKNADLALYRAKAEGRSTYRFFRQEMNTRLQAKRKLEVDLRAAIAEQQFEVYYQPLVSAETGVVLAFEALLRWHHPTRGMVSPTEFIPLAEETGLISKIGLWVLNQASQDAMHWPSDVKLALNLSPLQFRNPNLRGDVEAALHKSGLRPDRLELEITESLMLHNAASTLAILHDLRRLGVCISMDDFGTGYSSLSYLCRFPFDKIKIDRSFIQSMDEGSDGLAIVKSVISLGRSLRMVVVAEGVETAEQMKLLTEAGCQELQGYLFSPPQPAKAVQGLIERLSLARVA